MKIKITQEFRKQLNKQVKYISRDKSAAARRFKNDLISRIKNIPKAPFSNRKSIYFDRDDIRDLIFKRYIVVYRINMKDDIIEVFGFTKYQDRPFQY